MRRVLSNRYRITYEKFQYHGVEICTIFRVFTLYNSQQLGSYVKYWCVRYYRIDIEEHKNNSSTNE